MLKAKIWPKMSKSNSGKLRAKASRQPEFRMKKKIKGDGAPRGGDTDPPQIFVVL